MPAPFNAQQNVYVINSVDEWPEELDPFILYNQTYDPGSGLYYYNSSTETLHRISLDSDP